MRTGLLLAALLPNLAWAACPNELSASTWSDRVAETEALYAAFEFEQFRASVQELALDIPCVNEPLAPSQAARYHRLVGIDQFTRRRPEAAAESFLAARSTEPDFAFSPELIPEEHAIRDLYRAQDPDSVTVERIASPEAGQLRFDGRETLARPRSVPTIFQYVDAKGRAETTSYLAPTAITPDYPVAEIAEVAPPSPGPVSPAPSGVGTTPTEPPPTEVAREKKGAGWLIAGGVLTAGGVGCAAGALAQRDIMASAQEGEVDKVDAAWAREQAFGYTAYGLFGLGATAVTLHFVF